jgi:hypothetical protein
MIGPTKKRVQGTAGAPKPLAGYVLAMSNPYGITLDREWTEWP